MEKATKGLVLIAGVLFLAACGGSSSPPPASPANPPPQQQPPAEPPPAPLPPKEATVVLTATPELVAPGASATLSWSAPDADTCVASGAWSGDRTTGGQETSPPIHGPTEFRLQCDGPAGTAERVVTVDIEAPLRVSDKYGRRLGGARELVIVDWEGPMANPAMPFYVTAAEGALLPLSVTLSADNRRLHFNKSSAGEDGPRKSFKITDDTPVEVFIANYPDRDFEDTRHDVTFTVTDGAGDKSTFVVRVLEVDHDRHRPPVFNINVDYRHDTEGYFDDPERRATATDAVKSWAYFIDDMQFDEIPAGDERTYIWTSHPDGYVEGFTTTNPTAYSNFLVYLYGFTSTLGYSAGTASEFGDWQHSGGQQRPFRRSGMIAVELTGTYDRLGWITTMDDENWYGGWNNGADLWSTVLHEAGHVLMMSAPYPKAKEFRTAGAITDEAVREYYGAYPPFTSKYHLLDVHDPESQTKAFGSDLPSPMRSGRRTITKLDLLLLQAVGYKLRDTTALQALALSDTALATAGVGLPYAASLEATGGIPYYDWTVTVGELPDGLTLDAFDGVLYGTPTETGTFEFTVRVEEYGGKAVTRTFTLEVA